MDSQDNTKELSFLKDRLRSLRKKAGLSQAELAKRVGARQGNINDLESGRNKSSKYLIAIAEVFAVDPLWLERGVCSSTAPENAENRREIRRLLKRIGDDSARIQELLI